MDGYYLPDDFGVSLQGTAVRPNLRKWEFVLDNTTGANRRAIFGIICVKP